MAPGDALAWLRGLPGRAIGWVLPARCLTCEEPAQEPGTQCAACFRGLGPLRAPFCARCGVPLAHAGAASAEMGGLTCPSCAAEAPAFDRARAAYWYDEAAKRLILPFKHGDRPEIGRFLARRMAAACPELLDAAGLLVPVPLHPARLRARRYNQAAVLAAGLARIARRPHLPDALRRRAATPPLGELGRAERRALLAAAFEVSRAAAPALRGKRVLLVDDVMTSGATADACARALIAAGASAVDVIAVARVPDRRWSDA